MFLITVSPMSATCHWDCSHNWTFTPQSLIFAIWRVARCLPWGGEILFDGNSWKRYYCRSYPEVTFPIFIFHPCDQTPPFPSIILSSHYNYKLSNYQITILKLVKKQDKKLHFILKFKAWWDFNLSGSIPPCTLLCSSSHLVVVQVSIWFNRQHGDLYRLHW